MSHPGPPNQQEERQKSEDSSKRVVLAKGRSHLGYRSLTLGALRGFHTALPEVLRFNPSRNRAEVEQMLARLSAYPAGLDIEIENLKRGMAAGWVPPKPVLQRVLAALDALLVAPEASAIYEPFKTLGSAIPADEQRQLRERALKIIATEAQPALGSRFGIRSIPTLALFSEGRELARQAGAMGAADIVRWTRQHLPSR